MVEACRRIMGNKTEAEDAASQAVAKVLANPPWDVNNWNAYLCTTARNVAKDILRKKDTERWKQFLCAVSEALPDQFRDVELRMDTQRLLGRMAQFLGKDGRWDLVLFWNVEVKRVPKGELAKELGMPREELKRELRKVRKAVRDAGIAACLVDDRSPNRCVVPVCLLGGREGSPALLKEIRKHVVGCGVCRDKWSNLRDYSGPFWRFRGWG